MSAFDLLMLLGVAWFTMLAFVVVLCRAVGQTAKRDILAPVTAEYPSRLEAELAQIERALDAVVLPAPQAGQASGGVESTLTPRPRFRSAH